MIITIALSGADTISMAMDEIVDATSPTTRPVTRRHSAIRLLKPKWQPASAWSTITRLD